MKKTIIFIAVISLCAKLCAQYTIYVHVTQNEEKIEALGTAAFPVYNSYEVTTENDKKVLIVDGNEVAVLPLWENNAGDFVVESTTTLEENELNIVCKDVSASGYATLYSPFQLKIQESSDVEVYVPTYDAENHIFKCNDDTKVSAQDIIPAGTGLLLKNEGTITFTITADDASLGSKGALSGSALNIPTSAVNVAQNYAIYTLGHAYDDKDKFCFMPYNGEYLGAGLAYFIAQAPSGGNAKAIAFQFQDGTVTTIEDMTLDSNFNGKILENGRIVIQKSGVRYNINGQEIR